MIDAETQHTTDPEYMARAIESAVKACGSQKELCRRSGLSKRTLNYYMKNERTWSFQTQFLIESIATEGK